MPLSNLMEQQIEDVIAGRLKRRPGSSRSPGFQKIPGQYICPADQIEPTSHLGRAMNGRSGMIGIPGNGLPDNEPSDSSDFSSSQDDDLASKGGSQYTTNCSLRWCRSQENHWHSRPKQKLILKPVAPAKYNGEPNSELFLTFMDDANTYLCEGGVPRKDCVHKIGAFLTGKAQQFYHSMIRDQAQRWHLKPFFKELYNYCFPLMYRMEQRRLLM